jgi:hypothetical protein
MTERESDRPSPVRGRRPGRDGARRGQDARRRTDAVHRHQERRGSRRREQSDRGSVAAVRCGDALKAALVLAGPSVATMPDLDEPESPHNVKAPLLSGDRAISPNPFQQFQKEVPKSRWRFLLGVICGVIGLLALQTVIVSSLWGFEPSRTTSGHFPAPDTRYVGPTRTGNEAYMLATATARPMLQDHFPLAPDQPQGVDCQCPSGYARVVDLYASLQEAGTSLAAVLCRLVRLGRGVTGNTGRLRVDSGSHRAFQGSLPTPLKHLNGSCTGMAHGIQPSTMLLPNSLHNWSRPSGTACEPAANWPS